MNSKYSNAVKLIYNAIDEGCFPCACLEIGDRSGRIFRYWEGNRAVFPRKEPVYEDTIFDMASVTKIVSTTMIALRFIEEGRICLSDNIGHFLPGVPEDKKDITVFHLLTHTSGLGSLISIVGKASPPERVADAILELELAYPVGCEVAYSCLGFILLGKILEAAGGDTLDCLSQKYVFEPLELVNTTFKPKGDNIASTDYDVETGECSKGVVNDRNARFLGGIAGNAGIFSNLDDMSRFAGMLANGGVYKGKQYLSPATLITALQNYTPKMSKARGLGFMITGAMENPPAGSLAELFSAGSFGHSGSTGTSIVVDRETGLYVILLTNRVHSAEVNEDILHVRRVLHNSIIADYLS